MIFMPQQGHWLRRSGFTLIELLVVVAIISVLMALLAPALESAMYQAELAVCGANLKGVGSGAAQYAFGNKRSYFYREAVRQPGIGYYMPRHLSVPFNTSQTANLNGYDDRPMIAPYVSIKSFQCPLAGKIDLESSPRDSYIFASYSLWAGWKYDVAGQDGAKPSQGMYRVGDKLGYDGFKYSILAGDTNWAGLFQDYSTHPDDIGSLSLISWQAKPDAVGGEARQNEQDNSTVSEWRGTITPTTPGKFDFNFAWDDGSVRRIGRVNWGSGDWFGVDYEPRMDIVPAFKDANYSGWSQMSIPVGN